MTHRDLMTQDSPRSAPTFQLHGLSDEGEEILKQWSNVGS